MNLTIDIGNTYTKIAVFYQDKLIFDDKKKHFSVDDFTFIRKKYGTAYAVISSVSAEKSAEIESQLMVAGMNFHRVNHLSPLPFVIDYATPQTLGIDRIAAMAGSMALYGEKNYLTIDAGSCLTYDLLIDKHFIGGNIAPGLQMRLDAMHSLTSALPRLTAEEPDGALGKTTASAMMCGAYWGIIYEIESIISRYRALYPDICVIATGGDSEKLKQHLPDIIVDKHLVDKGLNLIAKNLP